MKNLFFVFILFVIVSCQKEQEKTLQDYHGKYSIESTITKLQYNDVWVCHTGLDSIESHIADSLASLIPRVENKTVVETNILTVLASPESEKEIKVLNMFKHFLGEKNESIFYNPSNTNELIFLNCNTTFILDKDYENHIELKENEIYFDFKMISKDFYTTYTYTGIALKID